MNCVKLIVLKMTFYVVAYCRRTTSRFNFYDFHRSGWDITYFLSQGWYVKATSQTINLDSEIIIRKV